MSNDHDSTLDVLILTAEELASGEWMDEQTALRTTGLSPQALKMRRHRGSVEARPARRVGKVTRDFWYRRSDIESLSRVGNAQSSAGQPRDERVQDMMRDLEMSMLRVEAREELIARLTGERDAALEEAARLRKVVKALTQAIQMSVDSGDE